MNHEGVTTEGHFILKSVAPPTTTMQQGVCIYHANVEQN